ncbi:MAG: T9SS type A sorting domain-containing protein [Bacteroidetes bacterium]|nr:T9SS type A sorting domain-containing protein [Bacteroidota bacterium]
MPFPRVGMCSATIGDTLYLIGGAQSLQVGGSFLSMRGTSTVQAFDLGTRTWITNIAPLGTPRVFACAAALNDSIYVMGGVDSLGRVLNSVEVYDPAANRWHYASSMKYARKGAAATTFGDNVLVFGGGDSMNNLLSEVEGYSPMQGIWKVLPHPTLFARAFHHVTRVGNSIYIFGGLGSGVMVGPLQFIERYVPSVGVTQVNFTWRNTRAFFGSVTRNDSVFVISGWGQSGMQNGYYNDVDVLDFKDSGTAVERSADVSLEEPRRGCVAAAGRNGQIYVFGGITPESGQYPVASVSTLYNVTAVEQTPNTIPAGFKLSQNYPNPFNPTTRIQFDVPSPGSNVRLDVFNILGEKAVTLVDGFLRAGSYSAVFNGANMATGTYIYRLQTPNGSIYRKMVLIK